MSTANSLISNKLLHNLYRWAVIVCALPIIPLVVSDVYQNYSSTYVLQIAILAGFTYFSTEKISIKGWKFFSGEITIADVFTFIAMFMLGMGAAVLVAVIEIVTLLKRFQDKSNTNRLFHLMVAAVRIWLTCVILENFFGNLLEIHEIRYLPFASALCVAALSVYLFSFLLLVPNYLLRDSFSELKNILRFQLWSSQAYLVSAILAGIFIEVAHLNEWAAVSVITLFLSVFYLGYRNYIKTFDALEESESKFRSSFDYAPIGMAIVSYTGEWLQINDRLRQILKLETDELPSSNYKNSIVDEDLPQLKEKIKELIEGEKTAVESEVRLTDKNGNTIWMLLGASKIKISDIENSIESSHLIFQFQNIDSRKKAEERLRYDATHDSLTDLPNRAAFLIELQKSIDTFDASENNFFAALFIDLDNFKIINDSLGHNAGDELLKVTARRLSSSVQQSDTVARLGGDEFTILVKNLSDISEANIIAERILNNFSAPLKLSAGTYMVGMSIGIVVGSGSYKTAGEMLRDADAAMYRSKSLGKNRYSIFEPGMFMQTNRALQVINDLPQSIKNNEIILHYQPIQDLQTSDVVGFEVLSRWHHPVYGTIPPLEFIPLAEEFGIIHQLDDWVLLNACKQLREWQNADPEFKDLTLSINISPNQLLQNGFVDYVKWVLKTTGISSTSLNIEITETVLIKSLEKASEIINILSEMGVKVALDDFGTGYSSLSYLRKLPISILKIDRSFVQSMESNPADIEILQTIIELASKLKMKVTAEGIETYKQFESLQKMNCHFGQGYNFSRPVEAKKAMKYLVSARAAQKDTFSNTHKRLLQLVK